MFLTFCILTYIFYRFCQYLIPLRVPCDSARYCSPISLMTQICTCLPAITNLTVPVCHLTKDFLMANTDMPHSIMSRLCHTFHASKTHRSPLNSLRPHPELLFMFLRLPTIAMLPSAVQCFHIYNISAPLPRTPCHRELA